MKKQKIHILTSSFTIIATLIFGSINYSQAGSNDKFEGRKPVLTFGLNKLDSTALEIKREKELLEGRQESYSHLTDCYAILGAWEDSKTDYQIKKAARAYFKSDVHKINTALGTINRKLKESPIHNTEYGKRALKDSAYNRIKYLREFKTDILYNNTESPTFKKMLRGSLCLLTN